MRQSEQGGRVRPTQEELGVEKEEVAEALWGWTQGAGRKVREELARQRPRGVLGMPREAVFGCPVPPWLISVLRRQYKVSLN